MIIYPNSTKRSCAWFKFWLGFIFSIEMNEKIKPSQNLNHTQMKMWNVDELSWLMILFFRKWRIFKSTNKVRVRVLQKESTNSYVNSYAYEFVLVLYEVRLFASYHITLWICSYMYLREQILEKCYNCWKIDVIFFLIRTFLLREAETWKLACRRFLGLYKKSYLSEGS